MEQPSEMHHHFLPDGVVGGKSSPLLFTSTAYNTDLSDAVLAGCAKQMWLRVSVRVLVCVCVGGVCAWLSHKQKQFAY